jgi:hypothetical protein
MFLENPYQLSYVTADLDAAIAIMKEQFGVEGFRVISGSGPGLHVWTPEGEGEMVVKTAVARAGKWVIEIMEPVSGPVGHFRDHLEPGQPLRMHHIGVMTDDFKGGRLIYVDARATLGHYVEYVWTAPRPEAAA